MFYHVKDLQFNARVSGPDPRFAALLLEQFGGPNGELKAALQYFVQAFAARQAYPDKYDMLMDIATEEFSHLEVVGATITMLMDGINGELKNAAETTPIMKFLAGGKAEKEQLIHEALMNPQFLTLSGGGPRLTDSQGTPWMGSYVNANGDLTVDLRSDLAAESRAKIVYEYLMKLTDDPMVKESLGFLMTREVSHYKIFAAALDTIEPNFPPGVLQADPRYSHLYFNMSNGTSVRGPWNEGQGSWEAGENWVYIEDPIDHVVKTQGLTSNQSIEGTKRTMEQTEQINKDLSQQRSREVKAGVGVGANQWSAYQSNPVKGNGK